MTAKKLLLLLLAVGVSADYWTDRGYTYEVYEFDLPAKPQNVYQQQQPQQQYYYPQQQQQYYPQQQQQQQKYYPQQQQQNHHHQQQKHQQQQYYPQIQVTQQPTYDQVTQQTNPSVSVSEAEWVCTNTKTQDMMIIASEDGPVPNRVNGQQQWHQVYPQQPGSNQPNYPQPQQPVYPQPQQPVYPQTQAPPVTSAPATTTEDTNRPIWGGGGNDNRYPQTQAPITSKPTTTTTEDTNRPIWGDNNKQPNFPEVKPSFPTSTTQKPVDPLWPNGGSGNKPGFTVIEPTRKPKPHKTTKAPIDDDDDDGPLEIVMG